MENNNRSYMQDMSGSQYPPLQPPAGDPRMQTPSSGRPGETSNYLNTSEATSSSGSEFDASKYDQMYRGGVDLSHTEKSYYQHKIQEMSTNPFYNPSPAYMQSREWRKAN